MESKITLSLEALSNVNDSVLDFISNVDMHIYDICKFRGMDITQLEVSSILSGSNCSDVSVFDVLFINNVAMVLYNTLEQVDTRVYIDDIKDNIKQLNNTMYIEIDKVPDKLDKALVDIKLSKLEMVDDVYYQAYKYFVEFTDLYGIVIGYLYAVKCLLSHNIKVLFSYSNELKEVITNDLGYEKFLKYVK